MRAITEQVISLMTRGCARSALPHGRWGRGLGCPPGRSVDGEGLAPRRAAGGRRGMLRRRERGGPIIEASARVPGFGVEVAWRPGGGLMLSACAAFAGRCPFRRRHAPTACRLRLQAPPRAPSVADQSVGATSPTAWGRALGEGVRGAWDRSSSRGLSCREGPAISPRMETRAGSATALRREG